MKCCMLLRSLDRGFVFELVKCLCIGVPSKDTARFVDLGFWSFEKQEEQEYKKVPKQQTTTLASQRLLVFQPIPNEALQVLWKKSIEDPSRPSSMKQFVGGETCRGAPL